jgi:hypothetical protein
MVLGPVTVASRMVLCAFLLGVGVTCDRPGRSTNNPVTHAPIAAVDSAAPPLNTPTSTAPAVAPSSVSPPGLEPTRGPRETLAAYLAGSVFRRPAVVPDSLEWCPDPGPDSEVDEGWEPDMYIAIARPRVLGIRPSGEDPSGQGHDVVAEVLRLAHVTRGDSGWVAHVEITPDTLVWRVLRRRSGAWAVCGPALPASAEGLSGVPGFLVTEEFARRGEINGARWLPRGASWDAVARLADSVR